MKTPPAPALGRLRAATTTLHDALEAEANVLARLQSPTERGALVESYRCMFARADASLRPFLAGLDGLPAWRMDTAGAALPPGPVLADRDEALGFHYVMQGSSLGGRTMLRELERHGVDTEGLGFLNPYGDGAGAAWRGTLALLERHLAGDATALERAACGARKAYAFARTCLCGQVPG